MSRAGGGAKEAPRWEERPGKGRGEVGIWGERGIEAAVPRRQTLENDRGD